MGRLQGGIRALDSARAALIVGGIATALAGAALFAIVAHTRTPWSTQRIVGLVPLDSLARADFVVPAQPPTVKNKPVQVAAAPVVPAAPLPPAPPDSLLKGESVVDLSKPVEAKPVEAAPIDTRVAEMKILGVKSPPVPAFPMVPAVPVAPVIQAQLPPVPVTFVPPRMEPRHVEPKAEPKPVPIRVAETRHVEPKLVKPKVIEVSHNEPRHVAPRMEVRRVEPKPAVKPKFVEVVHNEPKRVPPRIDTVRHADAKTFKATPVSFKPAEVKHFEPQPSPSWIAEAKRAADQRAEEAKLAEAKHAAELKAEEWKLDETRREVQATLAETRAAQAKLDETKRAFETTLAEARPVARPAVETRILNPGMCETCGTVTAVLTRALARGAYGIEVRVHFGTGSNGAFLFPTDPGFSSGDRVRLHDGRLTRM